MTPTIRIGEPMIGATSIRPPPRCCCEAVPAVTKRNHVIGENADHRAIRRAGRLPYFSMPGKAARGVLPASTMAMARPLTIRR